MKLVDLGGSFARADTFGNVSHSQRTKRMISPANTRINRLNTEGDSTYTMDVKVPTVVVLALILAVPAMAFRPTARRGDTIVVLQSENSDQIVQAVRHNLQ